MTTTHQHSRRCAGRIAALVSIGALAIGACGFGAPRFADYNLPAEEQRYTMTLDYNNTHTTWRFLSSRVSEDETPEGFVCSEQIHAAWMGNEIPPPCRAEPLIFLRYDAGVDLINAVSAAGVHRFDVTAYRQATDGPRIQGLRLWTSVDGGETWRPAVVIPSGHGRDGTQDYRCVAVYPPASKTNGSVSLRAESWDTDGNRIEQRVDHAFYLR
ncbi:MAG TPA: hypothetical protein VEX15_19405 [Nocardioidaceae bacterium]|nr:hypothetical protein [Nocardioidaceae bacterium]